MTDHPHDRVRRYFTEDQFDIDRDPAMARAIGHLKRYFSPGLLYSGSAFDQLIAVSPADRFVADDIVAVSMLSVNVPARAAHRLLSGEANSLLQAIPMGASIWTSPELLDPDGAAWALWDFVRSLNGVGPVTTSKLLAAKRPNLVPVYDQYVSKGLQTGSSFWKFWQDVVRGAIADGQPSLPSLIHSARDRAGVPVYVSDLRVVDAVVWMVEHGAAATTPAEEAP